MLQTIILWLERQHLNHATAIMWGLIYYSREVTSAQRSGRDVRAFWPGSWAINHDRLNRALQLG